MSSRRGHRAEPHTADVIVEAWGWDAATCAQEAARGLLDICVSRGRAEPSDGPRMEVPAGSAWAMVEAVLEGLIYLFDVSESLPVDVSLAASSDGGLSMRTHVVAADEVQLTGAAPKAVVMLSVETSETGVRCRFIVDV